MKRAIFLAAAVAAASSAPALAQTAPDPGKMFMINAVTPGVVSFSGEGTAQFNNSSSTNNAFSVGSNTNFGVNASVSSTNDYLVDSNALFKLAAGSQLQQTIGTSSSAANTQAASESAATAANTIANTRTESAFGQDWNDFKARNNVASATNSTDAAVGIDVKATSGTESIKTEAAYNAAKKDYMQQQREEAYSSVTSAATSSSSSGGSDNGVISGTFNTSNKSSTQISASAAGAAANNASATATAEETYGKTYSDYTAKFASFAGADGKLTSSGELAAAKAAGIDFAYDSVSGVGTALTSNDYTSKKQSKVDSVFNQLQQSAASQGTAESESTAVVKVTGIGSIASLQASGDSAFNVDVATRLRNSIPDTNGTANGSAGGNLATSSFANQSNTQSASAFIQAFGADTVTLNKAPDGTLAGITANGRFNVTVDANAGYTGSGTNAPALTGTAAVLEAAKIYVP